MKAYPITQADRDVMDDVGLADPDYRIGTGPHAFHYEEVQAT